MENKKKARYSLGEEIFSSVTHGVGALLAIAGLVALLIFAARFKDTLSVVSCAIYGGSLIILYLMSTLYHSLTGEKAKKIFRICDHCSIFLLIAGSYTPYTLIALRGQLGYTIFGVIWTMAILGIVLNFIDLERYKKASLICYILMGWAVVFALRPLIAAIPPLALGLLVGGGISYTIGVFFYVNKRKYMHSVWHLFVLTGSVLHYVSVLQLLLH